MATTIETARKENKAVLSFIEQWQSKNEYRPETIKQYNEKFIIEFSLFLNSSNFSKETIECFTEGN